MADAPPRKMAGPGRRRLRFPSPPAVSGTASVVLVPGGPLMQLSGGLAPLVSCLVPSPFGCGLAQDELGRAAGLGLIDLFDVAAGAARPTSHPGLSFCLKKDHLWASWHAWALDLPLSNSMQYSVCKYSLHPKL